MALSSQSMNLDYIRTFVILGQSKTMTEASNKLNVNVSNVSRHIAQLEHELQTTLIAPTPRNKEIQLTEDGKFFFEKYEKIYNEILLAEKEYKQTKQLDNCKITIGVNSILEECILKPKILEFSKIYPSLNIKIVNGNSETLAKMLSQYALDVVVNFEKCDSKSKLQSTQNNLIISTNYVLVYNEKYFKDVSDLSKIPLILPTNNLDERKIINEYFKRHEIQPNIKYEMDSVDRILSYVADGLGASIILKDSLISKDLKVVDIDLKTDIYLSYLKEKLTPTTQELIKIFDPQKLSY